MKQNKDGLKCSCKSCALIATQKYRKKLKNRSSEEVLKTQKKKHKSNSKMCTGCNLDKKFSEYNKDNTKTDQLTTQCKGCMNKLDIIRKDKRREFGRQYKNDKKCINCGNSNSRVLDFAHIARESKARNKKGKPKNPSHIISINVLKKELLKTKILCKICHRQESYLEELEIRSNEKISDKSENIKKRELYQINRNILKRKRIKMSECKDCKLPVTNENHIVFDFDHLPHFNKILTLNMMRKITSYKEIDLINEIAKCELRCANCHQMKTEERRLIVKNLRTNFNLTNLVDLVMHYFG